MYLSKVFSKISSKFKRFINIIYDRDVLRLEQEKSI